MAKTIKGIQFGGQCRVRSNLEFSPQELKGRLEGPVSQRPFLMDVREPHEFAQWRIEGSANIPLAVLLSMPDLRGFDRKREIVTICPIGIRSADAAEYLTTKGFKASNLEGGLVAWGRVYDTAIVNRVAGGLAIYQLRRMGKGCTSYVLSHSGECVVVDPGSHTSEYTDLAAHHRLRITHVVDTHLHADHVSGAKRLAALSGATLHLGKGEKYEWRGFEPLAEGSKIDFGVELRAVSTPGHTWGSTCLLLDYRYILTGDTLFVDSIARPDLHGEAERFSRALYNSYHSKLMKYQKQLVILPAHFTPETNVCCGKAVDANLGEVVDSLPPMHMEEGAFVKYILSNLPQRPYNYEKIIQMNAAGSDYDPSTVDELEAGPNRCALKSD